MNGEKRFMFCNSLIYVKYWLIFFLESLSPKEQKVENWIISQGAQEYFEYLELCNELNMHIELCMGPRSKVSHNV